MQEAQAQAQGGQGAVVQEVQVALGRRAGGTGGSSARGHEVRVQRAQMEGVQGAQVKGAQGAQVAGGL